MVINNSFKEHSKESNNNNNNNNNILNLIIKSYYYSSGTVHCKKAAFCNVVLLQRRFSPQ